MNERSRLQVWHRYQRTHHLHRSLYRFTRSEEQVMDSGGLPELVKKLPLACAAVAGKSRQQSREYALIKQWNGVLPGKSCAQRHLLLRNRGADKLLRMIQRYFKSTASRIKGCHSGVARGNNRFQTKGCVNQSFLPTNRPDGTKDGQKEYIPFYCIRSFGSFGCGNLNGNLNISVL